MSTSHLCFLVLLQVHNYYGLKLITSEYQKLSELKDEMFRKMHALGKQGQHHVTFDDVALNASIAKVIATQYPARQAHLSSQDCVNCRCEKCLKKFPAVHECYPDCSKKHSSAEFLEVEASTRSRQLDKLLEQMDFDLQDFIHPRNMFVTFEEAQFDEKFIKFRAFLDTSQISLNEMVIMMHNVMKVTPNFEELHQHYKQKMISSKFNVFAQASRENLEQKYGVLGDQDGHKIEKILKGLLTKVNDPTKWEEYRTNPADCSRPIFGHNGTMCTLFDESGFIANEDHNSESDPIHNSMKITNTEQILQIDEEPEIGTKATSLGRQFLTPCITIEASCLLLYIAMGAKWEVLPGKVALQNHAYCSNTVTNFDKPFECVSNPKINPNEQCCWGDGQGGCTTDAVRKTDPSSSKKLQCAMHCDQNEQDKKFANVQGHSALDVGACAR